ncbi:hypothetical protein CHH57_10815 [Niallia circulans]|uniref:Uncharacterized protein n=1 Tax=Niallia circulans TaxID=1397 RepID=A0AA91Z0V9_NIACI|nr:hypothetical protein CHH57_10815 [Niallia circulans]
MWKAMFNHRFLFVFVMLVVWLIREGVWLIDRQVWLISAKLAFNIFSYSKGKKGTDPKNNKKPISHSDIPRRIGSF